MDELDAHVGVPEDSYIDCQDGIPENHYYIDLRWLGHEFDQLYADEQLVLDFIARGGDMDSDAGRAELGEDNLLLELGLDPGVASTVAALALAGAVPMSSCNGRPGHYETHPLVAFWCASGPLEAIARSAAETKVQICGVGQPGLMVWTPEEIEPMRAFARHLVNSHRTRALSGPDTTP